MNAKQAHKEAGKVLVVHESLIDRDAKYFHAQGYLTCLEGEEVKALVEALELSDACNEWADNYEEKRIRIEKFEFVKRKALAKFKEAVK